MRKTSGVFTLAADVPPRLAGSLMSGIDEQGIGWVLVGYFLEDEYLRMDEHEGRAILTIRRELMETVLGALSVLLAANRWMKPAEAPSASHKAKEEHFSIEIIVARRGQPGLVRSSWEKGLEGIERSDVDGQVNLRFREDLAEELARLLAHELGRVAATSDD